MVKIDAMPPSIICDEDGRWLEFPFPSGAVVRLLIQPSQSFLDASDAKAAVLNAQKHAFKVSIGEETE